MIGCPFGSLFQVESGPKGPYLSRVVSTSEGSNTQRKDNSQLKDELKDNRAIIDDNTAQSLSGEDIDAMRRQGAAGDEIVEALIANSSTFEKKTLFSQEKYRLRKQKKYAPRVLMRRPFARSICEAYFKKHPARIGFMRIDALSLLLSMANVGAYSDVLVVDMVGGILTGAVAERLGGTGYVCNTYLGDTPYSMDIVRIFNFSDEINRRIMRSPLSNLCSSKSKTSEHSEKENALSSVSTEQTDLPSGNGTTDTILTSMHETNSSLVDKPCKSTKPGERASPEILESWKQNGFSSLIIAAPELDTWKAVQELLPLLSYSAPFAIYHQYLQPLATCMHKLQVTKMAIGLQISEPWLREYQVLPSRTHPCMQMSAFGGYILSGMRIYSG
ncbi:PREDICTED: tRNA (adenine(58)-N(1))-methyltransferase non-catalytic subunit TRM6 isoform X2 [Nelumbo nucifera]|nr:PREDICTED: tRNA (adenine(58)-N(1))-methyltransferase non-catalytic subunit TRM6 isoform X2 [Nelumbo nucifera]